MKLEKHKSKAANAAATTQPTATKRGPGRPKTISKDITDLKSLQEKPKEKEQAPVASVEKRGPGRPKTKKVEQPATIATASKRGPGRPAGSKNVTKTEPILAVSKATVKRGRPSNAEKVAATATAAPVDIAKEKGKPGRKTKIQLAAMAAAANGGSQPENKTEKKGKPGRPSLPLTIDNQVPVRVSLDDYAKLFANKGVRDYQIVLDFVGKNNISITQAIGLLSGTISKPAQEITTAFKLGKFRVVDETHAQKVVDIRMAARDKNRDVYHKPTFLTALDTVLRSPNYNEKQMLKNLSKSYVGIEGADTSEAYVKQLKEIYDAKLKKQDRLQLVTQEG